MTLNERIIDVKASDLHWGFEEPNPNYNLRTPNSDTAHYVKVDPFPCYSHKIDLITDIATGCEEKFPVGFPTFYFNLPHEVIGRTNAHATWNWNFDIKEGENYGFDNVIVISGKRIPLHPAMTRYLVSHEYGHIVDNWICFKKGLKHGAIDREYAEMRGFGSNKYGGGSWSENIGEIFANDFRIVVCGIETEFWPHECEFPLLDKNVISWWDNAINEFSFKNLETT